MADTKRHAISGFRFARHFLVTFFDTGKSQWVFEHWENDRLVESKRSEKDASLIEEQFSEAVTKITNMFNAHSRMNRTRALDRHSVPRGVRVRTYDPAKRNTGRNIFDYYRSNTLPDPE